jgi:hypothetical protein
LAKLAEKIARNLDAFAITCSGDRFKQISVVAKWSWPRSRCNASRLIPFCTAVTLKVCGRTWGEEAHFWQMDILFYYYEQAAVAAS